MYKFSDIAESREGEKMNRGKGCYVNAATGIVIALLAIAISVGVGLIVHFAENRTLECNFPEVHVDGEGSLQAQVDGKQLSTAANPGAKPAATAMATSTSTMRPAATASASKHPTLLPSSGSTTTSNAPPSLKDVRLPTSLKPTHYRVKLNPDLYGNDPSKFTFEGHVEIEMNCSEPTSTVTLHINQLNVSSVRFGSTSESSAPRALSYTEDKDRQFFIIQLDKPTSRGQTYFVEMDFVGPLKDDLKGFYLSTFKKGDKTMYAATTQFEPTDARKAFPCFDEPQLKATFQVTLVRRGYLRSVSNMPRTNTVPIGNNMIEDHYETSKVMSTYLLAFIIGDFSFTAANTTNGLLYRAWSVPDSVEQTHTALDIGIRTIVNYEKYFGIGFPLPKQDMIALPDFAAGAMENWGLITYRETAMLFQPGVSSQRNLQRVTTVITHELAHQWFGDLVTMQWWDDLWLNEGFATFVECMGADFLNPDWKMFEQFVVDEIHEVMDFDGLVTSHPVYVPVNNPDEINEIFDKISYSKGASIIRMMRFVLGEENFRKGINLYLTRRQYQNAFHDDLWKALSDQSITEGYPIDVKQIMDTWILQMNYPVVRITTRANKVLVQQSRFLSTPDAKDSGKYTSQFGYKWRVPITYTSSASPKFNTTKNDIYWLNETDLEINHNGAQDENWILGNIQQYGFYRVTYEDKNWMALVSQLKNKHQVIHEINRAQLINDAWSLARAGQLSTYIALQTLEYLHKELNYVPWAAAQKQLKYLESMLKKTDLYGQFESFMKTIVAEPFKHYGMDDTNSTHIETYIRSDMVKLACSYGLTECTNKARQLFNHWMDNPANNPIDPDLRDTVYCTAIAEGASEEWDFAFEQFKLATVASEKAKLMEALACSKSTWLLSRYLNIAITPTEIRKQDATKVLVYIAENSIGQALAWDFVRSKWDYLLNEYGKGVFSFTKLIAGLTASFNTEFQLTQLNDFLTKNPYMGTGTRAFQQAIEKTQTNIKWMTQNKDTVADWLKTVQTPMVKARATDVRLPQHLIPYTYDVLLKPNMYEGDPAMFTFDGYVKIYMEAKAPGSNVTVHTNKLTIDEDSIKFGREDGVTGGPVYSGERSHDDERQFEIFSLDKEISVGDKYFIEMNFTGPLTGDLAGLYLSQYQRGNTTVYIATTQMEATDARKAFPCFDEPEMKATFTVKLVRKSHMKSMSNMPIIGNESVIDDFVVDIYNTSERMSTYLIAFIICDFEYTEDTTTRGIKYRAWARPESINQTYVALEAGVKIIDYYEKYFGIDYPLPKQDMIAVPDFAAGAMENWGLITYRETAMLYEAGVSSEGNLQRVNVVIAHELAHQWFGDLVTMDWWDDLWLNEGFASFVEYMGVDHLHPDWKMFEQFVLDLYGVFEIDSLVTSHPIYVPVANPEEINEIFDEISYSKGASVIRMMRFFLGEEVFQNGVQIYLKKREFANANHDDLWAGLTQAATQAGKTVDVKSIMDTWILQMNCPVIKVTKTSAGKIAVEQKRFLSNPDAVDPGKYPSPFNYTWKVPFTYATKNGRDFNQSSDNIIWLDDKQKELPDQYPKQGEWIIGNVQQFGVYRVNYDDSNWIELFKQLDSNHKVIDVINRGQIINDAFGLAKADQLSMRIALDIVGYLQDEEEYIPWEAAGKELAFIDTMLSESSLYGLFERFMRTKVEKQFERLGLNNTGAAHLTSYMRSLIAAKACAYGNDKCVTEANKLFNKYMTTKVNPIDPALKTTVYCTALRTGGEEEWEFAFDLYNTATVAAEKSRLLSALSCTRQPWLLYRLLDLTLLPDIIRKQDAYKVYISVGSNPVGILISWNFFRENWDKIFKEYGTGSFSLANIIKGVTATFNTEYLLQQMKDFKAEHPDLGTGATAFSQAEESVQANIMWMNKNYLIVKEWLERNA